MMAERLPTLYPVGTVVQIWLGEQWQSGIVVSHQQPAVWVQTADDCTWFVTNRQRIRPTQNINENDES